MGQAAGKQASKQAVQSGVAVMSNTAAREALTKAAPPPLPSYHRPQPSLHDKHKPLVGQTLDLADGMVAQEPAEPTAAQRQLELFHRMQATPRKPQTPKQYVTSLLPAPQAALLAVEEEPDPERALVTLPEEALEAARDSVGLAPSTTGADGLVVYGRRPSEGSAADQLVLQRNLLNNVMSAEEVLELYKRHREDPGANTATALADLYSVDVDYVVCLLEHCQPPEVIEVDSELYGVWAIKALP